MWARRQGKMPLPRGVDAMFHKFKTYPVQHMLTCTCYRCSRVLQIEAFSSHLTRHL